MLNEHETTIAIILLTLLILLGLMSGCASYDNKPKCTWICPTTNIPNDCYCLEEEILREANSIEQGTKARNGRKPGELHKPKR